MKKFVAILLCLVMVLAIVACKKTETATTEISSNMQAISQSCRSFASDARLSGKKLDGCAAGMARLEQAVEKIRI